MNEPEGITPKRASGIQSLPSTGVGKWSAWLLVVSLVLIRLNNLAVMPEMEQQANLELAQKAFNLVVFLCVAFAGVTGLFAIVKPFGVSVRVVVRDPQGLAATRPTLEMEADHQATRNGLCRFPRILLGAAQPLAGLVPRVADAVPG